MSPEILEEPNNSDPVHFAKTELFGSATFYGVVIIRFLLMLLERKKFVHALLESPNY